MDGTYGIGVCSLEQFLPSVISADVEMSFAEATSPLSLLLFLANAIILLRLQGAPFFVILVSGRGSA